MLKNSSFILANASVTMELSISLVFENGSMVIFHKRMAKICMPISILKADAKYVRLSMLIQNLKKINVTMICTMTFLIKTI